MDYQTIQTTIFKLLNIRELMFFPQNWCQGDDPDGNARGLSEAFRAVGVETSMYRRYINDAGEYSGNLERGQIPEPVWFVREAMNKIAPEFGGLIYKWNDAPGRTHDDVTSLIASAIELAKEERQQLFDAEEQFNTTDLALDRWGETDGSRLCAMSALSKMLGYDTLTDMPWEVDPAVAALVNLLNDRATDKSRQLLASRLASLPFSGHTNLTSLISRVYFPNVMMDYGYITEVGAIDECVGRAEFADCYEYLSERFTEPDGTSVLATGCVTLSAALRTDEQIKQDLLTVSAVSQLVGFEEGYWWLGLLHILDYIIGIEDRTLMRKDAAKNLCEEYFASPNVFATATADKEEEARSWLTKRKDYEREGIKVRCFPALVERFPDQLDEIAKSILNEVETIGQPDIELHRFKYADVEIIITTFFDELYNIVNADADLVAYQEVAGELDLEGDGQSAPILVPVPASEAKTIH
jgi:hypothetical protein